MCAALAANGAPRAVRRPVDWRHLERSTCHGCHGEAPAIAAQQLMVAPAPQRARPTRVRRVRRLADVATLDVAAERAPAFSGKNNLLIQISNTFFSEI
jgi:hypothetical protein